MIKVLKTDGILPVGEEDRATLAALGVELVERECLTEEALIDAGKGAAALLVLREPVTARVIASLDACRIISRFGVGLDSIDVEAATAKRIVVTNVPDANVDEVSTHAMAIILALIQRLPQFDRDMREGRWRSLAIGAGMRRTCDLTLGLVGIGQIGKLVAMKAAPFRFKLLVHDPYASNEAITQLGGVRCALDELLGAADIVSLHIPLTRETAFLIDARALSLMKRGAILINVSRGGLIDEQALAAALSDGRLAAAGLDCFESEPPERTNPLFQHHSSIFSPHAAHYSDRSITECVSKAVANVAAVLGGARPPYQVNEPSPA